MKGFAHTKAHNNPFPLVGRSKQCDSWKPTVAAKVHGCRVPIMSAAMHYSMRACESSFHTTTTYSQQLLTILVTVVTFAEFSTTFKAKEFESTDRLSMTKAMFWLFISHYVDLLSKQSAMTKSSICEEDDFPPPSFFFSLIEVITVGTTGQSGKACSPIGQLGYEEFSQLTNPQIETKFLAGLFKLNRIMFPQLFWWQNISE